MANPWRIEQLSSSHQRGSFDCGVPSLDDFLRLRSTQYERRHLARTYVLVRDADLQVLGYYTLATGCLKPSLLPAKLARKLPEHPVPAALLGRLAIDRRVQGQGLGRVMLLDALARCATYSQQIGIALVEVHAIDGVAKTFYQQFGFQPLEDDERHLYLPMNLIPRDLEEVADS